MTKRLPEYLSIDNFAFAAKCLLHEAQYYNIPALEHGIRTATISPAIKHEYCVIKAAWIRGNWSFLEGSVHVFPLAEEASKALTQQSSTDFWPKDALNLLEGFMKRKNNGNSDGYKWEIYGFLNINKSDVIVVLKGRRLCNTDV